jgi:hydroxyacylglutathione hydrolase
MRVDAVQVGFDTCYLLRDRGTVLVDAGGARFRAAFDSRLVSLGVGPRAIGLVVITHGHFDHAGLASEIRDATGATIALHRGDVPLVAEGRITVPAGTTRWGRMSVRLFRPLFRRIAKLPPFTPDLVLGDDGLDLAPHGIPGRVVYTPGHTAGSVSVVLDTGEAFVGDLAMNRLPLTIRPSLPVYAEDVAEVRRSWAKLRALCVRTVYPAHGRPFPIEALDRELAA